MISLKIIIDYYYRRLDSNPICDDTTEDLTPRTHKRTQQWMIPRVFWELNAQKHVPVEIQHR